MNKAATFKKNSCLYYNTNLTNHKATALKKGTSVWVEFLQSNAKSHTRVVGVYFKKGGKFEGYVYWISLSGATGSDDYKHTVTNGIGNTLSLAVSKDTNIGPYINDSL